MAWAYGVENGQIHDASLGENNDDILFESRSVEQFAADSLP